MAALRLGGCSGIVRGSLSRGQREALAVALIGVYAIFLGVLHVVPRYDCLVFPLFAWAAFKLLDGATERRLAVALGAMGLFVSFGVLTHLWTTGHEGRSAILEGIVPASDAGQFLLDAERVLHGLPIAEASRRPLFVVSAAGMLRWLGNDLRAMLAVIAALFGLSLGYMSWETMRAHGRFAGFVVFVLASFWVRRFTGFVGTEDIAFAPGAIAFGLLLRTADLAIPQPRRAMRAFGAGMLCLSLGLAARPGPLLIMPALLAWAYYAFRGRARRGALLAGVAGVVVAFLALRIVASHFATGAAFNDYPNIVYALIHRCDLGCAVARHPELAAIPLEVRPAAILAILRADIANDPSLLVLGPLDALFSFVFGAHGFFGFIWNTPDDHVLENGPLVRKLIADHGYLGPLGYWVDQLGYRSLINAAVMGALGACFVAGCVAGTVRLFFRRRGRRYSLMLFVMLGGLASSVFTPTWIGEGLQMHSATFAFVPGALALGLTAVRRRRRAPAFEPLVAAGVGLPAVFAFLIITTALWPKSAPTAGCAGGVSAAAIVPSTRVILGSLDEPPLSQNLAFLDIHNKDLVRTLRASARPGAALAVVYDACAGGTRIALGDPTVLDGTDFHFWWLTPASEDRKVVIVTAGD